jgi:hypothetical protein
MGMEMSGIGQLEAAERGSTMLICANFAVGRIRPTACFIKEQVKVHSLFERHVD